MSLYLYVTCAMLVDSQRPCTHQTGREVQVMSSNSTRVIAIFNQKGGVGKTTTALSMSAALRASGRSVLLVDLDQQANATTAYGAETDGVPTAYDILTRRETEAESAIQSTAHGDIIPGDLALASVESEMSSMICRETILSRAMSKVVRGGAYDYVVIDCPPGMGNVITNALTTATEVLVPVLVDSYSLNGLEQVMSLVDSVREYFNPDLRVDGLVICQKERGQRLTADFDEQVPEIVERFGTHVLETSIRRCVRVREAQFTEGTIYDYAPDCTSARDYADLAAEVDAMDA